MTDLIVISEIRGNSDILAKFTTRVGLTNFYLEQAAKTPAFDLFTKLIRVDSVKKQQLGRYLLNRICDTDNFVPANPSGPGDITDENVGVMVDSIYSSTVDGLTDFSSDTAYFNFTHK